MTCSSDSSSLYASTVPSGPPLCQCSTSAPPSPSSFLSPFRPLRIFFLHPHHLLMLLTFPLHLLLPLLPLTPSGFFNGVLGVSKPGALNLYTFFRLIPLTLLVFRKSTIIRILLSKFLDSLRSDRTHSRSRILSPRCHACYQRRHHFVRQGLSFS